MSFITCSSLIGEPLALGDNSTRTPVRIDLPSPPAVIIGMAPAAAGDLVLLEGAIADIILTSLREEPSPANFGLHHHLLLLTDALPQGAITGAR